MDSPEPPIQSTSEYRRSIVTELCADIRASEEETRALAKTLHDEVVVELDKLGEHLRRRAAGVD